MITKISTTPTPASSSSSDPSTTPTESSKPTFLPVAPPSNAHMAQLAGIIVPPVVGGVAAGAAVGPKLWKFFGKMAKKMEGRRTAAQIARELAELRDKGQAARDIEATENMLSEAQRRTDINMLRQILTEEATNPGLLNEAQVESVSMVESGAESIWSGMSDMLVRVIVAVRMQRFVDKS